MIDLGSATDIERLYSAMDQSRDARKPFLANRLRMLREYVGSYYSGDGASYEVLVNLLNMTAEAYCIGLAANNPRCKVYSEDLDLFTFAHHWQIALNNLLKEIHFAETIQQIVLDAFFTIGIAKVFRADSEPVQLEQDVWADPGRIYVSRISPDDFGMDMAVKDIRRCRYMWDEYRVPWDSVRDNPDFDRQVVKELSPTSKWDRGEEEANQISAGSMVDDDELQPMVTLMDVWLPEIKKIGTFPRHRRSKPLKVIDEGPEGGPYRTLTFADVPDNVMPTAPAQNLMGLHLLYNGLLRKQARQAKRQQTNPIYRPAGLPDAERLKKYGDGVWVQVNDPTAVSVLTMGGVDQGNTAFSIGVLDLFDRQAGNLQAKMGLGPQAQTYGQEQLIYQAVSRKEAKMQSRVHAFVAGILENLAHLMWHDAVLQIPGSFELTPNSGVYIPSNWTPEHREGDFVQYKFDFLPYSMNYDPPEARLQKLERAMDRLVNLFPILQAQGATIDGQELVRQYADKLGAPELESVIVFTGPPMAPQAEGAGNMPETTRNYVRRNVATGGTPQARSMAMQQSLLRGANAQQGSSVVRSA